MKSVSIDVRLMAQKYNYSLMYKRFLNKKISSYLLMSIYAADI